LGGSPAANAGIKAGDTILQYGNKRIYSWNDLTTATSEGSAETTVTVTVERNGQQQQVYVPRGPLGIRLTTDSVLP
jgi:S1-C subfamily serine protease